MVSCPNHHDDSVLKEFKSRARARHEAFNARIKSFMAVSGQFRHPKNLMVNHKTVFEAVVVICQYQMKNGSPLFGLDEHGGKVDISSFSLI